MCDQSVSQSCGFGLNVCLAEPPVALRRDDGGVPENLLKRRKAASRLKPPARERISLAAVKKIFGHDRLSTTTIYLNLTNEHIVQEYEAKW